MRVKMNYGRSGLFIDFPDAWDIAVIEKAAMPVLADPAGAVLKALASPVACGPLSREAAGRRTACILICDITRPVPNSVILAPLIQELIQAGIEPNAMTVLVATGLHRPNESEELRELVGNDWVLDTVNVMNHFARNDADHAYLGNTSRGTPVRLDRRFVEADVKIATGLVEPHFMAGYSGGRKVVAPGIAHQDTITTFHNAGFLEHPRSANCILDGNPRNPLHEELTEIIRMLGRVLAVNTVIDDKRNLSYVNFGEIEASHLEAVAYMRRYAEIPVHTQYRTVITSGGGYPLDKTYYQTVKGMVGAMELLEPEGNIIIFSECSEGMGSREYVQAQQLLSRLGTGGFRESLLQKSRASIDEWQTEMQLKPMEIGNIHLFSDKLSKEDRSLTGVHYRDADISPLDFIRAIAEPSGRSIAVIPEGPYVMPRYQSN
ncbi:MAG: nickel-dependent lactate racemase [Deltaproteobacteria bacterium]|nr:nickel-dependent lactate racemase [Deltaproteobacteria bacterium]